MRIRLLFLALTLVAAASAGPLLVLSIDGLDNRYLRDADQHGLRIPHLRRLMREGQWASAGVVGVVPTVTWPSHTTLISGVPPAQHGILNNKRPKTEGGEYYWTADLVRVPTLLTALRAAGRKSGAVTWPVTVNAPVDFNLPEYFQGRNGGAMDLASIESKGTPGLVAAITKQYPSFPTQWMDDRARTLATRFILAQYHPDLLLVHLVDHDSEAHAAGPFTRNANALVERTDELIGEILSSLPKDYTVALVSDHGFARIDRTAELPRIAGLETSAFLAVAQTPDAAAAMRGLARKPNSGVGREIPAAELQRLGGHLYPDAVAAWEPADGFSFAHAEKGSHGLWPTRPDYRSVFVLCGPGIKPQKLGAEIEMTSIAGRFARILGVAWPLK